MANFNAKSKSAYNKKADNYDNTYDGRFTRKFKQILLSEIVLRENANVLDVACGNGSLLKAMNSQTPINGFGIDIADRMILNAAANNSGMIFRVAGCEAIPFDDCSMDVITACAAYHHFPDTTAFAREAKRVLKPEGKLYIADVYVPPVVRLLVNPFIPLSRAGDVKFYSPKEITRNFEQLGFKAMETKIIGHVQIVSAQK